MRRGRRVHECRRPLDDRRDVRAHPVEGSASAGAQRRVLVRDPRVARTAEDQTRPVPAVRRDCLPNHVYDSFLAPVRRGLSGSIGGYVQDFIPGVVVQSIVFITVYTGVGLATDINKGIFDRFRSLAIWQPSPVFGAILGDLVRYSIAAFIVIVLGLILGFRPGGGILGVLAGVGLVLVFAISLSWIWMVIGMKVKTPEAVMATSFLFLFPLTFLTNIFVFDLSTMPEWLQAVVLANPVTHLVFAVRGLMQGTDVLANVGWVLLASLVTSAVFAPLALRLYRKER